MPASPPNAPASDDDSAPRSAFPLRLRRDERGRLVARDARDRDFVGAQAIRLFPISDPGRWIAVCDAEGRELAVVEDLRSVPEVERDLIVADLETRRLLPIVQRIVAVSSKSTPSDWDLVTDRGPVRLRIRQEDDVRLLGSNRVLLVDGQGLRCLVPDLQQLPPAERRIVEWHL
jgi:hypothetical protein